MLQYPLLITWPKASDCLYNKEEIGKHSNLVTESKVTECNRLTLTILCRYQCHRMNLSHNHYFSIMCMPSSCLDTFQASLTHALDKLSSVVLGRPVHSFCRAWIVRLILLHSMTFDSLTKIFYVWPLTEVASFFCCPVYNAYIFNTILTYGNSHFMQFFISTIFAISLIRTTRKIYRDSIEPMGSLASLLSQNIINCC